MSAAPVRDLGNRDVIVIGGSAGAFEPLREIVRGLPPDLPAAVLVAIHRSPGSDPGLLAGLLDQAGPLPVVPAEEGRLLERGRLHIAPADWHLLVAPDGSHIHVRRGPRENRSRPAIDPLFRSAAASCTTRVIGVLLSGMLDDGSAGLLAIRRCGGLAVAQDPHDASFPEMPRNAVKRGWVDHVLPAADIAPLLMVLTAAPRPPPVEVPPLVQLETLIAAEQRFIMPDKDQLGVQSPLTCPECDGSMQEIRENGFVRYRCHTGHGFTLETLRLAAGEAGERVLYGAMRAQQQQAMVCRRMAKEAQEQGNKQTAEEFERKAWDYEEGAATIRRLIAQNGKLEEA
jgi:two-component system chemotaxis response regulator CheB